MMKNPILYLALAVILNSCVSKEVTVPKPALAGYPITPIDIKDVEITDEFWLPKIRVIQDSTIKYAFDKCIEEGRLDNFLIAGGKLTGKVKGKMPFDDTDLYKIIEGASYSLISKPNPKLDAYLDSVISIIKVGQEPDGYITTWFTIDRANPPAPWVKPSKERWENEISSHELYNSGHLFEAAAAHYRATGKRNFLEIALKNADLLGANFGPGKLHRPPGHQIVETGLIKLYQITNNNEYLKLSKFLLDNRGDSTSHELYGAYNQDHVPVINQEEAVGHAVRAEYMYAGMTDIAAIYNDSAYLNAVHKLWHNVVNKKMYITGGLGARHEGESFGDNYELPNLSAYSETCAAIGSVHWNQRLFQLTGDSKYYDIVERTLYNSLISGISLDGQKFFYPNPLESDGQYKFNFGACTRQSWFDCSCCPTNLIRFVPSIPGIIYSTQDDTLYVNLFMANKAKAKIKNKELVIRQETGYPWDGSISIILEPAQKDQFTVKVRVPGWAQNDVAPGDLYDYVDKTPSKPVLRINGTEEPLLLRRGYAEITRTWSSGDKITLELPMEVRRVVTRKEVRDNINKVAFEYGPLVYCAEEADNNKFSALAIPGGDFPSKVVPAKVVTEDVKMIEAALPGGSLKLIPYYVWSNRCVGKMKVWF
jgi:uncharacterized protein